MDKQKSKNSKAHKPSFLKALKNSSLSFLSITPMLLGVIGLVGLLQTMITPTMLSTIFTGNPMVDTFLGTFAGSVASGNPAISYVLGGELLEQGISLYAVTAFILSWVTLGFIHLPMEAEVLGLRFVVYRNILAFVFTMIIAVLVPITIRVLA